MPNALIEPFVAGTIAILDVIAPSMAFNVETSGCVVPCGHSVRKPKGVGGTTVAFKTKDCAVVGAPQPLSATLTSNGVAVGGRTGEVLVSSTRHGVNSKSERPPTAGGAK